MDRPLEDANKLIAIENAINLIVLFKRIGFEAFMVYWYTTRNFKCYLFTTKWFKIETGLNNFMVPLLDIRFLKKQDLDEMYSAFLQAFSNYSVPFNLNKVEFKKKFVEKLNINFRLSVGAFFMDQMVGFIFTSISKYEGKKSAYNGGTGVVPEFRGQKITSRLYDLLIPELKACLVKQCVLEVLTDNKRAIQTYEAIGFKKAKFYHCFRMMIPSVSNANRNIEIHLQKKPDWKSYLKFFDHLPSFLDTESMINQNMANEKIIEARIEGKLVGYAIYQPGPGRISHIAVDREHRRTGIGTTLINYIYNNSKNKSLILINVNKEANGVKNFFSKLGFENQLDQYEMILKI